MARKRSKQTTRVERFLERFTPFTTMRRTRKRASEAHARGVEAGYQIGTGEDEPGPKGGGAGSHRWGYRKGRGQTRDVANISYPDAVELVWKQHCGNPLARRLGLLRRDQVVNTEIRPKATEPKVQEVIDAFWDDPVNAMGVFVFQFGLQIGLFGTQVYPSFTSIEKNAADGSVTGSGLVRLGYIDPGRIKDIVLDPDNARIPIAVVENRGAEGDRVYRAIHVDETPGAETEGKLVGVRKREAESVRRAVREALSADRQAVGDEAGDYVWVLHDHGKVSREQPEGKGYRAVRVSEAQKGITANKMVRMRGVEQSGQSGGYQWEDENGVPYDGACFLFRVNHVMNGRYGWPDTLHLVDWLDQADMFFFDIAERIFFLTLFIWDVLMEGLDEDEIAGKLATMPVPKRGAIRGHNETMQWNAVAPDLGQADMEVAARVLLHFIAGIGFGIPETWLGAAQTTRYAGAKEAVAPARKLLETRQSYIRACIRLMVQFQIDQAILAKQLPEEIDTSFVIQMPEVSKVDLSELASTLKIVAEGLIIGIGAGIVKPETGIKVIHKIINAMGVDIDPSEMEEMTLEEKREARKIFRLLQQLEQVEIGVPLTLKDLMSGADVTPEDLERVRREWDELLSIAQIEEEE